MVTLYSLVMMEGFEESAENHLYIATRLLATLAVSVRLLGPY